MYYLCEIQTYPGPLLFVWQTHLGAWGDYFSKWAGKNVPEGQGDPGKGQLESLMSRKPPKELEGGAAPGREEGPAGRGLGSGFTLLSWHGREVELPQLLPIKQSWHFRARHRRWLPALEVSVWPLSQHCLPSPSPLTSVDQTKGPNRPIVILPGASMGPFRGFGPSPPRGHFLLPHQGALGHSLCLCGWGVWLW